MKFKVAQVYSPHLIFGAITAQAPSHLIQVTNSSYHGQAKSQNY